MFHLPQDLRLSYDHGVERAGNPEQVTHGILFAVKVQVRLEVGGANAKELGEEVQRKLHRRRWLRVGDVVLFSQRDPGSRLHGEELDAVAGRKDQGFPDPRLASQAAHGLRESREWNGKLLAHRERRRGVVHADQHERGSLAEPGAGYRLRRGRSQSRTAGGGTGASRLTGGKLPQLQIAGGIAAHGALNLWTTDSWLAAQTASTKMNAKLDM